jgi:hypothetical protein
MRERKTSWMNQIKFSLENFVGKITQCLLLPISSIGLISGDKPLLLLEARESKDMKERPKMKKQKVIADF